MAQWGQQGFQQPGFQQQPQFQQQQQPQFQQNMGINPNQQFVQQQQQPLMAQRTGFPGGGMQPQIGMQPQMTGFPAGGMQPQMTGFVGGSGFGNQGIAHRAPPPPPVPQMPPQFQGQQQQSGFLQPQQQQPNRFLSPSPGIGAASGIPPITSQPTGYGGIMPQQTGFPGAARPLVPQVTGFMDPKLQMMSTTFMPLNQSAPYQGGVPQLPSMNSLPGGQNLVQGFQNYNQDVKGSATVKVPWALTKHEKKQYDGIFRAWDKDNTGFINGATALEVFGQSGLGKDDLARVWALADVDDRGMLNLPEFHVAMGLIYRCLNGNDLPDTLPPELVPPSARDLDGSVNFLKDILKNENRSRSPSGNDTPVSRLKDRSLYGNGGSGINAGRDATIYKHEDSPPPGGVYKPSSRHVDREAVRSRNDIGPGADLKEMKNMLSNTSKMLERANAMDAEKTEEDEELEREMEELRYRVKRVSDDLDHASRGPRNYSKDQRKRELERELLTLTHDEVPRLERRLKDREERREMEKRQWVRDRDRANERFGKYSDRDRDEYRAPSRGYDDRERSYSRGYRDDDRPYSRGPPRDDDRPYSRGPPRDDDRSYSRSGYRDDRRRSPELERARSPPRLDIPPAAPASAAPVRATPSPSPSKSMASMTKEERQAEVQRRIEARKAALGIVATPSQTPVDTSVEDRLVREKAEAEEKAKAAEKEAEQREAQRQARLASERAAKADAAQPSAPRSAPTPPTPAVKAAPPPPAPRSKAAPPPPKPRAPPAPVPRQPQAAPKPTPAPVVPEEDSEEEAYRIRQEELRKRREAREAEIRAAEEADRAAEEAFQEKMRALKNRTAAPRAEEAAPPPPPPPAPAGPMSPPAATSSTNPFSKLLNQGGAAAAVSPPAAAVSNPWGKPAAGPISPPPVSTSVPPAPPAPAAVTPISRPQTTTPAPVKSVYQTVPDDEDDWDVIKEKDADSDSDSDEDLGRAARLDIANKLFKGLLPSAPASPAPQSPSSSTPPPASAPPAPPPPPPPPAATGAPSGGPPPPPPPPPAPTMSAAPPAAAGGRGALFASIQAGAKLKKAQTVDKSAPAATGRVIGDVAPPDHIRNAPVVQNDPEPEPLSMDLSTSPNANRQSVDWYQGLASAQASPSIEKMPTTREEDEPAEVLGSAVPDIQLQPGGAESEALKDIDFSKSFRSRSLYPFEGEGAEDCSFEADVIVIANPSKSGGDWWFGTVEKTGRKGVFPKTFVAGIENLTAVGLYDYEATSHEELSFHEGEKITVVSKGDGDDSWSAGGDWWKVEKGGVVYLVPAAYLELEESAREESSGRNSTDLVEGKVSADPVAHTEPAQPHAQPSEDSTDDEDDDSSDGDSDYMSFSEDDDTIVAYPETKAEREAREHERQMVLAAAGLIIKQEKHMRPPPRPPRRKARNEDSNSGNTKRRAPPMVPQRSRDADEKHLPDIPPAETQEPQLGLEDAYDRYEAFRTRQATSGSANRLSVASFDSQMPHPPASPTGSEQPTPSMLTVGGRGSGFLQSLGRLGGWSGSGSSSPGGTGSRLVISGPMPISQAPSSDGNAANEIARSPSPSMFGSSWASMVDRTALEGIPTQERKRQEAIFEFIATEGAYVHDLQLIVELFYQRMIPVLEEKATTVIFANVEDILIVNTTFFSELEERQKDCRLYMDRIGDILDTHMANMGVYMEYCVNQANAGRILQTIREENSEVQTLLTQLRDDPSARSLDLSSYLLIPMQRITRYPLLLKQVLHFTDESSGDEYAAISRALSTANGLLSHINEAVRAQEGREILRALSEHLWIGQGRLDLCAPMRSGGERRLVREGLLSKRRRGGREGRKLHVYLCSDILVLTDDDGTEARRLYRMPISVAEAQVRPFSGDDTAFEIGLPYPRGGDKLVLKSTSSKDCQQWTHAIESTGKKYRQYESRVQARR